MNLPSEIACSASVTDSGPKHHPSSSEDFEEVWVVAGFVRSGKVPPKEFRLGGRVVATAEMVVRVLDVRFRYWDVDRWVIGSVGACKKAILE